ncbi:hypothetical protein LSTR_LSTR002797 [Laodelphax striatellus]|uniref:MADF domain-containing protein n=1 Tax=Laodelphax striatellus TaxID=195883 RepID=A0A482XI62_LAOST|nr:hypothetical protein LSTR_LSTR002797 [Laodelphax striatellus]
MMMNRNNWFVDEIDTNSFIAEVEKRPELWDSKVADKSFKKRQSSWDSICEIFSEDYRKKSDIERHDMRRQLQRRWKSLRDSFTREISKMKSSSQGEGCTERKPYMYFKELVFLLDVVDCGSDNVVQHQNDTLPNNDGPRNENIPYNDRLEDTQNDPTTLPDLFPQEQSKSNEKESQTKSKKVFKTIRKHRDDGDRLFMLSLSKELEKVPDKYKIDVKLEILQAIMKGQKRALQAEQSAEDNFINFSNVAANVTIDCATPLNQSPTVTKTSLIPKRRAVANTLNHVNSIFFLQ